MGWRATTHIEEGSWGDAFKEFESLKELVLELETVEEKMEELDANVRAAGGWRLPLKERKQSPEGGASNQSSSTYPSPNNQPTHTRALVLNPTRTKRKGWIGKWIEGEDHGDRDPVAARKRLEKHGVDFAIEDGEVELTGEEELVGADEYRFSADLLVYYVVTLVFEARNL